MFPLTKALTITLLVICNSNNAKMKPRNNACKNVMDYLNYETNKNCFFNPDMDLEVVSVNFKDNITNKSIKFSQT